MTKTAMTLHEHKKAYLLTIGHYHRYQQQDKSI